MRKSTLINDFAIRCFRDTADQDYIAARLSYRHGLYPQFYWQSLQAIEKYIKAILLFNRIKAKDINHDLIRALKYTEKLPFELRRSEVTRKFIEELSEYGRFRYLEASYSIIGPKLAQLDKSVWEIRRYCAVLNYEINNLNGELRNLLQNEISKIETSEGMSPQKFRLQGGLLEKIIDDRNHRSRAALIWQNLFFGVAIRKKVFMSKPFLAVNSPLFLHPEILEDLLEYVFLPKDVINAYRELAVKKKL